MCIESYNEGMKKIGEYELGRIDGRGSISVGSCPWLGIQHGIGKNHFRNKEGKKEKLGEIREGMSFILDYFIWTKHKVIMQRQSGSD